MSKIEAETAGEKIIQLDSKIDKLDGKVDYVVASLERVISAFERLENVKITDLEVRMTRTEKWQSEWKGMWRLISATALVLGMISLILGIISFLSKT